MPDKTFEIGLCMAGAVSAGAYTAGAMDYLLEALENWEKERGKPGIPNHKVVIKVIGGASAGGMTGIITASAVNNPIPPVASLVGDIMAKQPQNKFYHTWVDLTDDDMFPKMLNTDDIKENEIYSLLNSDFIDQIATRALNVDQTHWVNRPYVDAHLKFFTTLTNLEGLKFNTKYNSAQTFDYYLISRHNDYATFVLNTAQNQYASDGWIPIDFRNDVNVNIARDSAMATGAFPIGLKSRKVSRSKEYINDLKWHKDITLTNPVGSNPYDALIVDGGMIDNEPFLKVKSLLNNVDNDFDKFGSTVLMIDPFPSSAEKFDVDNNSLLQVIGGTLSAMLGQMRTKPEVLEDTLTKNYASQFLIAPRRKIKGLMVEGSKAIACGFLGGFGGFLHKEFRIHDYFLGRANAEQFLREHFVVPLNTPNPIFKEGYEEVPPGNFVSFDGKSRQIIPIFSPKKADMYMPIFVHGTDWPVRKPSEVERYNGDLKQRIGALLMNLADYGWLTKILLGIGNRLLLRRKLASRVMDTIKKSMNDHALLKED
jgi:hypothetical protein